MREIKFRAWDGSRMYYFNNFEWTLDYNDISGWNVVKNLPLGDLKDRKWDAGESSSTAEHFQLMQYTGLDDKNGKEIYEGDIIEINHPWGGRTHRGAVQYTTYRFEVGGFWFTHFDNPDDIFSEGTEYIEVIGNIYENTDILKEPEPK